MKTLKEVTSSTCEGWELVELAPELNCVSVKWIGVDQWGESILGTAVGSSMSKVELDVFMCVVEQVDNLAPEEDEKWSLNRWTQDYGGSYVTLKWLYLLMNERTIWHFEAGEKHKIHICYCLEAPMCVYVGFESSIIKRIFGIQN